MKIAILTTGRQDWGILRSTCRSLGKDAVILAGGMHCSARFGRTEQLIVDDGFAIAERLDWLGPAEEDVVVESARALQLVSAALERMRPSALLVVGDRSETACAVLAATLRRIAIVHLHGGEETEGAIDNALRHAITKMSHLHFVSHAAYRDRVVAMGEDPATVHIVGAPGLDNLQRDDLPTREELERDLGLPLSAPVVIVTYHPTTLGGDPADEITTFVDALGSVDATYVVTLPNADSGHAIVARALKEFAGKGRRAAFEALGERRFWGLLRVADAVVGNSSAAMIEAPALGVPTVNVGDRQKGRIRARTVVDVPVDTVAIADALRDVLRRRSDFTPDTSFGDGRAAERIVGVLRSWSPPHPPVKRGAST